MKKVISILLLLILIPLCVNASEKPFSRIRLNASYFGELVLHPGAMVGVDLHLIALGKTELHIGNEIGGYHHKWYHNAIISNYYLGFRMTSRKAFYFDPQINIGFFFTQPDGDIYTTYYSDEYPFDPTEPNTHYGLSLIFGWDLKNNPWDVFFGPDIYMESKVNHMFVPHFALKIGVAYKIGGEK
jgi:hypothetical protein